MNKDKVKLGTISLVPGIIMIIIMVIAFKSGNMDYGKKLSIIAIIAINPLLFILQGAFSAALRISVIFPAMCLAIAFLVCIFVFLNNTALPYLVFYGGIEALAYYSVKSMRYMND
ncbi:hypothetical protein [Clostridium sp.]|uniref:hypothetical protein n=1 Tax=Clostridium sp. TaxID=1506 RepID=UPI0034642CB7